MKRISRAPAVALLLAGGISLTSFISAATAAGGLSQSTDELTRQRAENSVALRAKLLCSGIFVIGRDPEEFIRNDLVIDVPGLPDWDEIEVAIDRERKSVTLQAPGLPPRTAVYNGDQGCTLLPRGADHVSFTPVSLHSSLPDPATQDWPMGDSAADSPLPRGVDRATLEAALDFAFDDSQHPVPQKTRAMVVLYKGRIIGERYAPGFDATTRHITWSMGKSITAALIGVLVREGHFSVDDPAPIAEWRAADDPRRKLTISHLLRMSSGLRFHRGGTADGLIYTAKDNHRAVYFGAVNVFDYSIHRDLQHPPNTVWRYRNCDPLSLGKIIRDTVEASGEEYLSFPQRALFDRVGMRNMVLEVDPWGNFIMTGFDYGTARDWARFGLLHLQDGVWQGGRILPEGWVDYITTPAPADRDKKYGALFWLNRGGRFGSLPEDMFWPAGHHGQVVLIIPSRQMVIVRLGHSANGGFDAYIEEVAAKILAAVE